VRTPPFGAALAVSTALTLIVTLGACGGDPGGASTDAAGPGGAGTPPASTALPGPATPTATAVPASPTPAATTRTPPRSGAPAGGPPFAPVAGKRWRLSFAEEFAGGDYDHAKLTPCFDWNYGACTVTFNHGRERYLPSQVVVSGGTAKLIAAPLSPPYASDACQGGSCTYKAGLLSTARPRADNGSKYLYAFRYGYVEARIKFPATRGFFTAFWMLPADPGYSYRTEIDILELLGDDPTTMYMTYHYADRSRSYNVNKGKFNNGACPVKTYSKGFVRMGVDWQPHRIAWYIDGRKCAEFTDRAQIESGPMQIILHMMVDNDWQRSWNVGLADATLTRQLEVDYIRVYQQV
jgi:hypothetical protein